MSPITDQRLKSIQYKYTSHAEVGENGLIELPHKNSGRRAFGTLKLAHNE